MATIVCGIDDSPGGVEALRVARTLSRDLNLRLVLAHVAAGFAADGGDSLTTSQARRGGDRLLERLALGHDLQAERRVEVGEAPAALAQIAAEEAATLIVVGSRRQGRLRPGLRSGLAGELAASAPCPVVIVPPPLRG
jgi:nucleotide-binding universal stress UspA family protein